MIFNVLDYLERSAASFPEKTAVVDDIKAYTYSQLLRLSKRIGSAVARFAAQGTPVAVLADKSADTLAIFMGIVQAGCCYSLMNPDLPEGRLGQILSVLKPALVITDEANAELAEKLIAAAGAIPAPAPTILLYDELMHHPLDEALLKKVRSRAIDQDPLYINFTSGSTGVPKGVAVGQRSVIDFIDIFAETFGFDENDRIGNQAPFDFDVSVKDIYTALKVGATLVVIPKALFSKPAELLDFICDQKVTNMTWAVSAICLISACHGLDYRTPDTVKRVLFSGEVMPLKHLKTWMEHLPEAEFVNLYGPTEITCNCTYHRVDRSRDYENGMPIGRPFPNEDVFLLNKNGERIEEAGVTGEICVRGTALALGYYAAEAETAKAFPQNPLQKAYPERIYRTGDLGKYDDAGELIFCGREDFQIKYMGHRIETEEIEKAIAALPEIERCCVLFSEKKQKLYGFYAGDIDKRALHAKLKETLPVYMVPGAFRQLEQFPLTKNGKIDRKLLLSEVETRSKR
ncbi:MAG: amino acid adenylation domain-containing protein [Lachnospiraceae bacterium]|nr:amino acid adenylation domain-containing protein [Lachnospiraceae bacterium]